MSFSAVCSIILPIAGFAIFWSSVPVSRANADYGHAALLGFIAWTVLGLGGLGSGIYSISHHKFNLTALTGLVISSVPILFIFYTIMINSR